MRGRPRADRAFLATAVTLSFALVLEVATFASVHALRVEERTMVYVVPLFLIALMLWIERGCPRPPLIAVPAAIAAVALPVALPYTKLIGLPAVSDTPALVAIWSIAPSFGGIGNLRWVVLVAGLAICAVFLFVPRRYALVLPVLVFVYFGSPRSRSRASTGRPRSSTSSRASPPRTPTGSTARSAATRRSR